MAVQNESDFMPARASPSGTFHFHSLVVSLSDRNVQERVFMTRYLSSHQAVKGLIKSTTVANKIMDYFIYLQELFTPQ